MGENWSGLKDITNIYHIYNGLVKILNTFEFIQKSSNNV